MQKDLDDEESNQEDDWGNPPSPDTPENQKKAMKAQIILGIISFIGILVPGILYWIKFKWFNNNLFDKALICIFWAMTALRSQSSGFTKLELILWVSIILVLIFLLLPFYNSWQKSNNQESSSNEVDSKFHFESWNEGTTDSNITDDEWSFRVNGKWTLKKYPYISFFSYSS